MRLSKILSSPIVLAVVALPTGLFVGSLASICWQIWELKLAPSRTGFFDPRSDVSDGTVMVSSLTSCPFLAWTTLLAALFGGWWLGGWLHRRRDMSPVVRFASLGWVIVLLAAATWQLHRNAAGWDMFVIGPL